MRPRFTDGQEVIWQKASDAARYGCGLGPFEVIHVRKVQWAVPCNCSGFAKVKHALFCHSQRREEGYALILRVDGKDRSFPEEYFELAVSISPT
jgi:hypothetical protein